MLELIPRSWTNSQGFHEKYQAESKLKVVKNLLAGEGGAKLLARQWSVSARASRNQHGLDGATLIHRPITFFYLSQWQRQIKYLARIDLSTPNQVNQLG